MWYKESNTAVSPASPNKTPVHKAETLKWDFASFSSVALPPPPLPSSPAAKMFPFPHASSRKRTNSCKDGAYLTF